MCLKCFGSSTIFGGMTVLKIEVIGISTTVQPKILKILQISDLLPIVHAE